MGERGILSIEGLTVLYGGVPAVQDMSLSVGRGRVLGLVGESGAGKSTVMRAACGLLPAGASASGRVLFAGEDLLKADPARLTALRGDRLATVFQNPGATFDPSMRMGRQIEEVLECHGVARAQRRPRVLELLASVGLPDPEAVARRYPFELSGGMLQRCALAVACAFGPDLLLADEATSALDAENRLLVARSLRSLARAGSAVLLVTHSMALAYHLCDEVAVMDRGRVVERGTPEQIVGAPCSEAAKALVAAAPRLGTDIGGEGSR